MMMSGSESADAVTVLDAQVDFGIKKWLQIRTDWCLQGQY